ncbi:MAG: PD-(D/E)XK nuclease family protein [Nannocystaceae bacterium]|nr:PD-(D/E)XK nuclease family protein [bacterium]
MPAPNIFEIATSELSQDAMLAWLLAWADPSNAEVDAALHQTGRRFLDALFATHGSEPAPRGSIDVKRQTLNIDVLARIGEDAVVAIEDKVRSGLHSNQLVRYREALEKKYPDQRRILVYLKTIEQASYEQVEDAGWKVFRRGDLLEVLGQADTDNAILCDYRAYLEGIEAQTQAFETKPFEEWERQTYRGFFVRLTEELSRLGADFSASWRNVPNAAGGFMGYWWNGRDVEHGRLYLQIESGPRGKDRRDRLVVKLAVGEGATAREARGRWLGPVLEVMKALGFEQPKRLGAGATMTLATLPGDYRVERDGLLDLAATVKRLRRAGEALARVS